MGLNRVIGKDNNLIWHLPNDLKFFKSMTDGHPLIMGRKTYESLPGKLPNRPHIIVTSNKSYSVDKKDVYVCHSLESAIEKAQDLDSYIFISGGSQIYQEAFDKGYIDEIFLTLVLDEFEGDTYFPNIPDNFILTESIPSAKDEKNKHNFIFMHYFKS
jgi:dihydrofolate reductase